MLNNCTAKCTICWKKTFKLWYESKKCYTIVEKLQYFNETKYVLWKIYHDYCALFVALLLY